MTKSKQTKKAGSSRKVSKDPVATTPKPSRTKERDPRLPAVGTTIVRPFKGTEHRIKVLEDGFELDGKETFRSLTGLARRVTGYPAISGPAWMKLSTGDAKESKSVEAPSAPKKRAPKVRRAGREPAPETSKAPIAESQAASESATA